MIRWLSGMDSQKQNYVVRFCRAGPDQGVEESRLPGKGGHERTHNGKEVSNSTDRLAERCGKQRSA